MAAVWSSSADPARLVELLRRNAGACGQTVGRVAQRTQTTSEINLRPAAFSKHYALLFHGLGGGSLVVEAVGPRYIQRIMPMNLPSRLKR